MLNSAQKLNFYTEKMYTFVKKTVNVKETEKIVPAKLTLNKERSSKISN